MSSPKPPLPNPDAPTRDYVGVAFSAVAFGVVLGTGLMALVLLVVRTLQVGTPLDAGTTPDMQSTAADVLLYGTGLALFTAGLSTWTILRPVRSAYRQGGLAMVTAFATLVVSLLTMPADLLAGRAGLAAVVVLAALGCWGLNRRVTRQLRDA